MPARTGKRKRTVLPSPHDLDGSGAYSADTPDARDDAESKAESKGAHGSGTASKDDALTMVGEAIHMLAAAQAARGCAPRPCMKTSCCFRAPTREPVGARPGRPSMPGTVLTTGTSQLMLPAVAFAVAPWCRTAGFAQHGCRWQGRTARAPPDKGRSTLALRAWTAEYRPSSPLVSSQFARLLRTAPGR